MKLTEEQRSLAEAHMGVAIAYVRSRRMLHRDADDYIQVGMLAVVKAAGRYGPHAGCDFAAYAYQRIRRAVADYRSGMRMIRLPVDGHKPRYKTRRASIRRARELAEGARVVSMDAIAASGGGCDAEDVAAKSPAPDAAAEASEAREAVRSAVRRLPAIHRRVVEACGLGGRPMKEYADELGVFPTTIHGHRDRGYARLRAYLAAFDEKAV